jgi:hypothetical protein
VFQAVNFGAEHQPTRLMAGVMQVLFPKQDAKETK